MTLRETVYARCTTFAGLSALIGTRCYPDRLPEDVAYPALVHHTPISSSNEAFRTHDVGMTGMAWSRIQFDSYAATGDGAAALADQVYAAWDGYKDSCVVGVAWQANRITTYEAGLKTWRVITDIMILHEE